jgi:hypothetical protein
MSFDPCNCALKIRESIWDSNSQHGSSLGSVKVHSLTFFALLRACKVIFGSPFWPQPCNPLPWLQLCIPRSMWSDSRVSLLARNLATPCLGRDFAFMGACEVTPGSPFWLATLQPLALVVILHSWEHVKWLLSSLLAHNLATPCLDRKPKARVPTQ